MSSVFRRYAHAWLGVLAAIGVLAGAVALGSGAAVGEDPPTSAPLKLVGVSATGGAGQATLSWTDPENEGITRYEYQQKWGDGKYGDWTPMAGVKADGTSYTVTGLLPGKYVYRVRAVTEGGSGPDSEETTAVTVTLGAPLEPDELAAVGGPGSAKLFWSAPLHLDWTEILKYRYVTKYQYQVKQDAGEYGGWVDIPDSAISSSYTVTKLAPGSYTFQLRAVNAAGIGPELTSAAATVTAVTASVPASPANLKATFTARGRGLLSWDDPGNTTIIRYEYRHKELDDTTWFGWYGETWPESGTAPTSIQYSSSAFAAGGVYQFQVRAVNHLGAGPASEVQATPPAAEATTEPTGTVPAAPANLKGTSPRVGMVQLSWDDPGDATITLYERRHKRVDATAWSSWRGFTWEESDPFPTSIGYGIPAFTAGGEYQFQVRAKNHIGVGAASEVRVTLLGVLKAPPAPTGFSATGGVGTATLTWDDGTSVPLDADVGMNIWHEYRYQTNGGWSEWTRTLEDHLIGSRQLTYEVDNLGAGEYLFQLRAANHAGTSSPVAAPTVKVTAPIAAAPTGVSAVGGVRMATLSWTTPSNAKLAMITKYQYQSKLGSGQYGSWADLKGTDGSSTSGTVTRLTEGSYTFKVRAVGAAGNGAASAETPAATVTVAVPDAPANLKVTTPRVGWVLLSWDDPGDPTITRYEYREKPVDADTWPLSWYAVTRQGADPIPTSRQYGRPAFNAGGEYQFQVRAVNHLGVGAVSQVQATMLAPRNAPPAPTGFSVTGGVGTATLTWNPIWAGLLDEDGIGDLIYYEHRHQTGSGGWSEWTLGGEQSPLSRKLTSKVSGLRAGEYQFQLRARNHAGASPTVTEPSVKVTAPLAAAPTGVSAVGGVRMATLSWTTPSNAKLAMITKYQYQSKQGSGQYGSWADLKGTDGSSTSGTVTRLTEGSYTFKVRAVGAAGNGAASAETLAATVTVAVPDAPANLKAATPRVGIVQLSWDDPGDPTITRYQYQHKPVDAATWPVSWYLLIQQGSDPLPTSTEYGIPAFNLGGEFQFRVRAVNHLGVGAVSQVQATMLAPRNAPPAPTGFSAAVDAGVVTLAWDEFWPSRLDEEGIGHLIHYEYRYQAGSGGWIEWTRADLEGGGYVPRKFTSEVGSLRPGEYQFQLRAANKAGASPPAAAAVEVLPVTLSISDVTVSEGSRGKTTMNFVVTLSGSPSHEVVVRARPRDGTATHGKDFVHYHADRTIVFAANATGDELSQTVPVYVLADTVAEDNETFTLLARIETDDRRVIPEGGNRPEATGTIMDDDDEAGPSHTISVTGVTVAEGNRGKTAMNFVVTLSDSPSHDVVVRARYRDGTATHSEDFTLYHADRTIVFAANATGDGLSQTVPVYVFGDTAAEDDETFTLLLRGIETDDRRVIFKGGSPLEATGTITDDDGEADIGHTISVTGASVAEGNSGKTAMNFVVTLSNSPSHDVVVRAGYRNGTATHGEDFVLYHADRTIVFAANATGDGLSQTVPVYVFGDTAVEGDETFTLLLAGIETADRRVIFEGGNRLEVTGTIMDDDGG